MGVHYPALKSRGPIKVYNLRGVPRLKLWSCLGLVRMETWKLSNCEEFGGLGWLVGNEGIDPCCSPLVFPNIAPRIPCRVAVHCWGALQRFG